MAYTLSDFDYQLPEELIAQQPAQPRDHARLLVYNRASGNITDDHFYNLPDYLPKNTTLVLNNSKVEKCRLLFDDGKKEIFILESLNDTTVRGLVRPGKKFKKGRTLNLTDSISATVIAVDEEGIRTLKLTPALDSPVYKPHRHTPFPPYIEQDESLSKEYQTVYAHAASSGASKAAPTAGLHFTDALLHDMPTSGIEQAEVTLHVGLGTFAPLKAERIKAHPMHPEWLEPNQKTADQLNSADHITAVGTTSVRVLESCLQNSNVFRSTAMDTDIFIRPGFSFQATDTLITNFHLPKSALLMLVAAYTGFEEMNRIYQH